MEDRVSIPEMEKIYSPATVEPKWQRFWEERAFGHAVPDSSKTSYSIVIPPPNVTAQLHVGHSLTETIQDLIISHRMRAVLGWIRTDHAGIATRTWWSASF